MALDQQGIVAGSPELRHHCQKRHASAETARDGSTIHWLQSASQEYAADSLSPKKEDFERSGHVVVVSKDLEPCATSEPQEKRPDAVEFDRSVTLVHSHKLKKQEPNVLDPRNEKLCY